MNLLHLTFACVCLVGVCVVAWISLHVKQVLDWLLGTITTVLLGAIVLLCVSVISSDVAVVAECEDVLESCVITNYGEFTDADGITLCRYQLLEDAGSDKYYTLPKAVVTFSSTQPSVLRKYSVLYFRGTSDWYWGSCTGGTQYVFE